MLFMLAAIIIALKLRRREVEDRRSPEQIPLNQNGLDNEELDALRRIKVTRENQHLYTEESCSICLADFKRKDKLIEL